MADPLTEVQKSFLRNYLRGVFDESPGQQGPERGGPDEDFSAAWDASRNVWTKAEEAVSAQVKALQGAFRKSGLPQLSDIANLGLPALTGNTRTKVMASVFEVERVKKAPEPKVLAQAEKNLAAMAQHLKSDPRIAACDTNPFGVKMSIAKTLGGAIESLRKTLRNGIAA